MSTSIKVEHHEADSHGKGKQRNIKEEDVKNQEHQSR